AALNGGLFAGISVDQSALLLRTTYAGDADLNGVVNALDFSVLVSHFGSATQLWSAGDFNYDGTVNTLDFNLLATNFGATLTNPVLGSLVPEPTTIASLVALTALLRRRRK